MAKRGGTEWITPAEFQELAKQSRTPAAIRGMALRKEFIADEVKAVEGQARSVRFRITSGSADRDRDTIAPAGWQLDNYRKNPVVMFGHDYGSLPVAKATQIESRADGLSSVAEFAPADVYPFADTVYKMVAGGFLNAASVGFRPVAWTYNEDRKGVDFSEQELLEWSIVPVPANAEALVEARSAGIDLTPLLTWAEEKLDGWKKEDGLYVPKGQVEAVFRILSTKTVSLPPAVPGDKSVGDISAKGFNPAAMPVETSWEWITERLNRSATDYLKRWSAVQYRGPEKDFIFACATWADKALIVVAGWDRPWSEDHVYQCSWTNAENGPAWNGEPQEVDIQVHTEIAPILRAIKETIGKRGRVLSAANEAELRQAMQEHDTGMQHHQSGMDRMNKVLAQVEVAPETDGLEITEHRSVDPVLDIEPPAKEELQIEASNNGHKTIEVTPEAITLAVKDSLAGLMRGIAQDVQEQTLAAINRARGRID